MDFFKLSEEQLDALLNYDPLPAPQQATSPNVTFVPNASGVVQNPAQLMKELLGFGTTKFDPRQANFDDFHSASLALGQLYESVPFGADLSSEYLSGLQY